MSDKMHREQVASFLTWLRCAEEAIFRAGGEPDNVLDRMGYDLIYTLYANNIHLTYKEPPT